MSEEKKVSEEELASYASHFSEGAAYSLLKKLRKATRGKMLAGLTGKICEVLGTLLSALKNPDMPAHLKALCVGGIGYIILPLDLIPDAIPAVGWSDDLASTAGVVLAVKSYSTFSLKQLDAEIDAEC